MTELRQEENQQELFQEFSGETKKVDRFPTLASAQKPVLISTTAEQLIFWGILAILFLCFMFFLGVLRGKSLGNSQAPQVRLASLSHSEPPAPPAALQKVPVTSVVAKPPEAARAADPARPYTIVLVTYKKKALAEKEAAALKIGGTPAFVAASGDYFVVCAGQYANIGEAKKDLKFFGSRYKGCFLKRR